MAGINHRKLYPTSEDNSTISCPDICDSTSTCPYGCYPYTDIYSVPPAVAPNLSAKHSQHISPFVIVIVTLLASGFFLVSSYFVMVRYCSRWSCFRQRQRQPEATEEEFLDENRGPAAVDHPIWYINTIGLQPSVIDSITIFTYKKGDYLIEGTECSVCLNEFRNDETLRLLPKCNHAFHIPCIDTWLRSHTNCPVCRAGIVSIAVTTPVASNRLNSNNLGLDEDSEGENSGNYEEFNTNQVIRDDEYCKNRTNSREIIEVPQVRDDEQGADTAKMSITSKGNAASWVIGDLNNKSMIKGDNYEVRSVRRSVSVDSLLAVAECHDISVDQSVDVDHVSAKIFGGNSRTSRIISGGSSMAQFLHKRPVRMKRSFSYASGRSFLSKQYSRTDSVLPL